LRNKLKKGLNTRRAVGRTMLECVRETVGDMLGPKKTGEGSCRRGECREKKLRGSADDNQ